MAGAEEVLKGLKRDPAVTYAGLVLNEKGYERAMEAGVDERSSTPSPTQRHWPRGSWSAPASTG